MIEGLNKHLKQTDSGVRYNGRMSDLEWWFQWTEEGNRQLSNLKQNKVVNVMTWDKVTFDGDGS